MASLREHVSVFYPPRARWYTRLFFVPAGRIGRCLHLDRFRVRDRIAPGTLLWGLLLPGFAFWALGRRMLGRIFATIYLLAGVTFLVALGYPLANIAFGVLVSIHATSICFLENLWLAETRFRNRVFTALGTLVVVWGILYNPAVNYLEHHWLMPLRTARQVVVIRCRINPAAFRRGDQAAYEISAERAESSREGRVIVTAGLALGPILALPGDRIAFTANAMLVNGQALPHQLYMPTAGEFIMAEKQWFIWPNVDTLRRGGIPNADIAAAMSRLALVSEEQILGKPFRHWFGRRQLK